MGLKNTAVSLMSLFILGGASMTSCKSKPVKALQDFSHAIVTPDTPRKVVSVPAKSYADEIADSTVIEGEVPIDSVQAFSHMAYSGNRAFIINDKELKEAEKVLSDADPDNDYVDLGENRRIASQPAPIGKMNVYADTSVVQTPMITTMVIDTAALPKMKPK